MKKSLYSVIIWCFCITIGFSQLNPDRHTTSPSDGWKSCTPAASPNQDLNDNHWVMFDFQSVYQINIFKLWNLNDPNNLADGVNQIRIDYSLDASTWTEGGLYTINQSEGSAFYEGEEVGNLNGASMRYVLITALSNYGGSCYGFDEARFYIGGIVPVELAYFNGECRDGERTFNFVFADASDFNKVEIQHSNDGQVWSTIFTIRDLVEKNKEGLFVFQKEDKEPRNSTGYFRLKIFDLDNDYAYSDVLKIDCSLDQNSVQIYPNPVTNMMFVDFDLGQDEQVGYSIRNVIGELLSQGLLPASKGANRFNIGTENLSNGTYILQLNAGATAFEKRFIKIDQ